MADQYKRKLAKVQRLAERRDRVATELEQAIVEAHAAGASLRQVAAVAGLNHETVRKVIRLSSYTPTG